MAIFLVDLENVGREDGLKGLEYLKKSDQLEIFYSESCNSIRASQMNLIRKSKCQFRLHKLLQKGKNALDFYIATRCGMLIGDLDENIVIVSNDKGFNAIYAFYSSLETNQDAKKWIHRAASIEMGILTLVGQDDRDRRAKVMLDTKMMNLDEENRRMKEAENFMLKISPAIQGMAGEVETESVLEFAMSQKGKAKSTVYTRALHEFGRTRGLQVYRIVRELV